MKDFSKVKFKWTFRDYQQVVLDNSRIHLKDKKIHITALVVLCPFKPTLAFQ